MRDVGKGSKIEVINYKVFQLDSEVVSTLITAE